VVVCSRTAGGSGCRKKFSKVSSIVILCSKFSSQPTFENFAALVVGVAVEKNSQKSARY